MQFDNGCVANFTASRISTERVRKLRFFQPRQYVSVDYTRQDVLVFNVDGQGAAMDAVAHHANPQTLASLIKPAKPPVETEEPLRAELRSFLDAVRNRTTPVVSLEDGRRALGVALEILAAIAEHSKRVRLDTLWTASSK
jgi:predicted dehydrogenase